MRLPLIAMLAGVVAGCATMQSRIEKPIPSCEERIEGLLRTEYPVLSPLSQYSRECDDGRCAYAGEQPIPRLAGLPRIPEFSCPMVLRGDDAEENARLSLEDTLLLFAGDSCLLSAPSIARLELARIACSQEGYALPPAVVVLGGSPGDARSFLSRTGGWRGETCLDGTGNPEMRFDVKGYPMLYFFKDGEERIVGSSKDLLRTGRKSSRETCGEAVRSLLLLDDGAQSAFSEHRAWNLGCLDGADVNRAVPCYDRTLDGLEAPAIRHSEQISAEIPQSGDTTIIAFLDDRYGGYNETVAVLLERAYAACEDVSFLAVFPPNPSEEYVLTERFYEVGGYSYPAVTDVASQHPDPVWGGPLGETFLRYGLKGGAYPSLFVLEDGKVLDEENVRKLKF